MYYEISFPGLGLSMNPDRILVNLFGRYIYWYAVIIAAGFLLAIVYANRRAKRFGIKQDDILDILLVATPTAIICARAYYCIFNWSLYADDPISVLYIWQGGLAIYGGVFGAALAILICTKLKHISTLSLLDLVALGFMIGQCIGRWGNFINRECFGTETTAFLRMGLTDATGHTIYVHPTFLYESLWNLAGFVLLHFLSKHRRYDGQIALGYLAWYGLGRGMIEGLRTDSLYLLNTNLRISQAVGFATCLLAVALLLYNRVFREHDPAELNVNRIAAQAAQETENAEESAEEQKEP